MAFVKHGVSTSLGPVEIKSEEDKKQELTDSPNVEALPESTKSK